MSEYPLQRVFGHIDYVHIHRIHVYILCIYTNTHMQCCWTQPSETQQPKRSFVPQIRSNAQRSQITILDDHLIRHPPPSPLALPRPAVQKQSSSRLAARKKKKEKQIRNASKTIKLSAVLPPARLQRTYTFYTLHLAPFTLCTRTGLTFAASKKPKKSMQEMPRRTVKFEFW